MKKNIRVAIAGAGIYGATIAYKLAQKGYKITLYDPLGIMEAASSINQFRVHAGYHYPRSEETIKQVIEARVLFIKEFSAAISKNTKNYYAIPHLESKTSPDQFEKVMTLHNLPFKKINLNWVNYDYISQSYIVDESLYNQLKLKDLIKTNLAKFNVSYKKEKFSESNEHNYDFIVYATYGLSDKSLTIFEKRKIQVAEKVLFKLNSELKNNSLVIIDGPFTAFDYHLSSGNFLFGSAKYTNHWETNESIENLPDFYIPLLNQPDFKKTSITNFNKLKIHASQAVPLIKNAEYVGSKFTLRVIEDAPASDRRLMKIKKTNKKIYHVFSGKVVSALSAAEDLINDISNNV